MRFLWLVTLWLVGTMLLTGLGRHMLGAEQAMKPRDLIVSSPYWYSLYLFACRLLQYATLHWRRLFGALGVLVLAVLLLGMTTYVERMRAVNNNQRVATLALTVSVFETNADGQASAVLHP